MLTELRIRNFALIDDLEVSFGPGMNVILGQTGAGKSLIVAGLGLLKGNRADFNKVRDESKKALIEGTFLLSKEFLASHPSLKDYVEEGEVTVSRVLLPSKAALCRINGETVSLSILREVMNEVLDIHSQLDAGLLYDEKNYLPLLDRFGAEDRQFLNVKKEYQNSFQEERKLKEDFLSFQKENSLTDKDFLEFQIKEIESAHLKKNEIEDLNEELKSLEGYEQCENAFQNYQNTVNGNEGVSLSELLSDLSRALNGFEETSLAEKANKAKESLSELNNNLSELEETYNSMDFSSARLDQINQRLFDLSTLQHKYGNTTEEILNALEERKKKLFALESFDEEKKNYEAKIKKAEKITLQKAEQLTAERKKAGEGLAKEVNAELNSLGLKEGGFEVKLNPLKECTAEGKDEVQFLIRMNQGGKFLKLKDTASGGENSRLNLALKAVFNALRPYDTLVFDEIDTGISGSIAAKVGEKISEMGKDSSLIVITHLPQVASFADHAFKVSKSEDNGQTVSTLKEENEKEFVESISVMMSGEDITKESLKAGESLRKEALKIKKSK